MGGPGASDRAGVLEDGDAFESDSIEAGGPRSLEDYPGHDTMQENISGGQVQRSMASAAAAVNNSSSTPGFVRVDGEWIDEHYESGSTTEGTHSEALPFTADARSRL